jgi:DnaJ-class molecular chaperone
MDYYHILKVSRTATIEQIKVSYRKLALIYHPDMVQTNKKEAELVFKRLSAAYQILGNLEAKAAYDKSIGNFSTGRSENVKRAHWDPGNATKAGGPRKPVTRDMFNVEMWTAYHYGDENGNNPYEQIFTVHSNGWVDPTYAGNKHYEYYRRKYARDQRERNSNVKWSADTAYEASDFNTNAGSGSGRDTERTTDKARASAKEEEEAEYRQKAKERNFQMRPGAEKYGMKKSDFLQNEKYFLSALENLEKSRLERKREEKKNTTANTRTTIYDEFSDNDKKDGGSCCIS